MWRALSSEVEPGRVTRFAIRREQDAVSCAAAISAWRDDASFRAFFNDLLAAAPYRAYFWETRPFTTATLRAEFEFILADSPTLARVRADRRPFERALRRAVGAHAIAEFPSLGRDAYLLAPDALAAPEHYAHLAAFVRGAPPDQQQALWSAVGRAVAGRVGRSPLWVSTSGLGVYWLHVRLDTTPKYYTHVPYRELVQCDDA